MTNKKLLSAMLSFVATVIVLFALGGITVFADETDESQPEIIASGYCGAEGNGENLSWTLDGTGLLTISGTGEMADFSESNIPEWMHYYDKIEEVTIFKGVTSIGDNAFQPLLRSLTSVTIPDSVTRIGSGAFYHCTSLTSITIPDSVTSIGDYAFEYCTSLTSITIPDSVTSIGYGAFVYCTSLMSITIPDSVTSISEQAFSSCTSLTSITIPDSVTNIGDHAFYACTSLASITIPDSVTSIGDHAFQYCTSLTSITIPDSVTSIGEYAFSNCVNITQIHLNVTPESMPDYMSYTFPSSIAAFVYVPTPYFSDYATLFSSFENVLVCDLEGTCGYCGAKGNCKNVFWTLDNEGVLTISGTGKMADFSESNIPWKTEHVIKKVIIKSGVANICNNAFYDCISLTSITIPTSVTSIGESAFYNCTSLASITIPVKIDSIGDYTFYNCTSLTSISIPNRVESIGDYAFCNCTSLVSVTYRSSVESIGEYSFAGCKSLTSITIPGSVRDIGYNAYYGCEKITEIHFDASPFFFNGDMSNIFSSSIEACVYVPTPYNSSYAALFSSFENIIILDRDGNISLGSGTHLYGYSLSLDGSVGVNFYMKLDNAVLECIDTAYMEFTVNEKKQQVCVKDLSPDNDGYYIFRCDVVAKEMADEITAQVYLSEGNPIGDVYTYSVRTYATYILNHPEKYSNSAIALVKAMLNYGAASQKYFKHNTDNLANSVLPEGERQSYLSSDILTNYYIDGIIPVGSIIPEKISLSLKSTITMKLYFKTNDVADCTFEYRKKTLATTVKPLTTTVSGEYTIVIIEGIQAANFCSQFEIRVLKEGEVPEFLDISPSYYAYIVLNQPIGGVITDDLKNVVSALWLFSEAAVEYNAVQPA